MMHIEQTRHIKHILILYIYILTLILVAGADGLFGSAMCMLLSQVHNITCSLICLFVSFINILTDYCLVQ